MLTAPTLLPPGREARKGQSRLNAAVLPEECLYPAAELREDRSVTSSDWLVVVGGIAVLSVALILTLVAVSRAVRVNGLFKGGLFHRPAAPLSIYALVLAAAAVVMLFAWVFSPRGG